MCIDPWRCNFIRDYEIMELCVCRQSVSLTFLTATWLVTCTSLYFRVLQHDEHGLRWGFLGSDGPQPKFEVLGHPLELIILERKIGLRWSFSGSDGPRPKFEVLGHPLERWFSGSICPQWAGHIFLKKTLYFTFHLFDPFIHVGQFVNRFSRILNLIWWYVVFELGFLDCHFDLLHVILL